MTTLIIFWILLLTILIGIVVFGYYRKGEATTDAPKSFREFVGIEIAHMETLVRRLATHARPHGERALVSGGTILKKGHDAFFDKLFGGIEAEKGKVASFFLKRIAEHKESLRDGGGKKSM